MTPSCERAHDGRPAQGSWRTLKRAVSRGASTIAVSIAFAAAVLPLLGLIPLAILRHHVRRALRPIVPVRPLAAR